MPPKKKTAETPKSEKKAEEKKNQHTTSEEKPPTVDDLKKRVSALRSSDPAILEIKKLLETTIKWNEVVYDQLTKINRHIFWMKVAGWFKVLIFVLPFIIGVVYFMPYINDIVGAYQEVLGLLSSGSAAGGALDQSSLNNLTAGVLQQLSGSK